MANIIVKTDVSIDLSNDEIIIIEKAKDLVSSIHQNIWLKDGGKTEIAEHFLNAYKHLSDILDTIN